MILPSSEANFAGHYPNREKLHVSRTYSQWYGLRPTASGFVPLSIAEFSL